MAEKVVIYALNQKFVNQEKDIPETARQVIYYSLAIGHHVGVIDCLQRLAEIPLADFSAWLERLPEGPARQKLSGIMTWGEIEVNRQHVAELAPVLQAAVAPQVSDVRGYSPVEDGPAAPAGDELAPSAGDELAPSAGDGPAAGFAAALLQALRAMTAEPALYLMIRRRPE